jgi:hypothetical protein
MGTLTIVWTTSFLLTRGFSQQTWCIFIRKNNFVLALA